MGAAPRLTHAELDRDVASLWRVGGVYELVAQSVEQWERPRCVGDPTGVPVPWWSSCG